MGKEAMHTFQPGQVVRIGSGRYTVVRDSGLGRGVDCIPTGGTPDDLVRFSRTLLTLVTETVEGLGAGVAEGNTSTSLEVYRLCSECGRLFDMLNPTDSAEWTYGHDCESA